MNEKQSNYIQNNIYLAAKNIKNIISNNESEKKMNGTIILNIIFPDSKKYRYCC